MRKYFLFLFFIYFLISCNMGKRPKYVIDQKLRIKLFQKCLTLVPKGPESVVSNDWDEVIDSCEDAAYFQSKKCIKNCEDSSIK